MLEMLELCGTDDNSQSGSGCFIMCVKEKSVPSDEERRRRSKAIARSARKESIPRPAASLLVFADRQQDSFYAGDEG